MKEFPELKENQVALLRAEYNTGHVVDEELKIVVSEAQNPFTIFNSLDLALSYSNDFISKYNEKYECVIYDKEQGLIKYFS